VVQDLLLWCTSEFGYLRLADGFVQCSSIMPQKRNPVGLEHARAIGSKAVGQAAAIMLAAHNTPFGDIVDTEDDLQPLVFAMFRDAGRAVRLVAAAMGCARFDTERMAQKAAEGWITVTELADTLARDHGVPFKAGHAIASRLIAAATARGSARPADLLGEISADVLGRAIEIDDAALATILSPRHFIEVRTTPGGPAPSETSRAIEASKRALDADRGWVSEASQRLTAAQGALEEAVRAI
jgi:argininosuccinate lyase